MIVRILTEGQYNLPGQFVDKLNEVDNQIVAVVEVNDEVSFKRLLQEMLELVRKHGSLVPLDEILESDIVLPEPDLTIKEAKELFTGEGLLPG